MFKEGAFHWLDLVISIPYIFIFIFISFFIRRKNIEEHPEYKNYTKGIIIKIIGAIGFAIIYLFYYKGGDTSSYFHGAETLSKILISNPSEYIKLILSSSNFDSDLMYIRREVFYAKSSEEWFVVKCLSPLTLLSINRFWVATIVTSVFSFYGSWKMYQSFLMFFPNRIKEGFWSVFFIPNVILWGSGMLKDTFTLAFLGILSYSSIKLFFKYSFKPKYILAIIISVFIISNIKAYILITFLPCLMLGWVVYNRKLIKSSFFRNLITPVILILGILLGSLSVSRLMEDSTKYQADSLESRAKGFHQWHTVVGGSSYNLGEIEYTPLGIGKKIPAALNVAYFRPYLFEVSNFSIALGALESFVMLILFVLLLFRQKLRWVIDCFNNPLLIMAFSFVLILGFIVGFTSYNFGALARYKIPAMPFFAFILLHFNALYKEKKKTENKEASTP